MEKKQRALSLIGLMGAFVTLTTYPKKTTDRPRLTIVFVVDQFAHHYLGKLKPHLKGGIKFLLDKGMVYDNAHFPHAMPGTGPGHAAIGTGTYPKDHGIIANLWFDETGTRLPCDNDPRPESAVLAPHGVYRFGRSASNIKVDGLSDQIMMQSQPAHPKKVFSLSLKSRAAIGMAGKLGKAIWFDDRAGRFTSSKAYFKRLPNWLTSFNHTQHLEKLQSVTWRPCFDPNCAAYDFHHADNYQFTRKECVIGKTIPIDWHLHTSDEDINKKYSPKSPFKEYMRTPTANQLLLDAAKSCLVHNLPTHRDEQLVLWISMSGLDKVGHQYGPHSIEAIDTIYHVDRQLDDFIKFVYKKIPKEDVLFALTGDHGVMPIPELLKDRTQMAHRILSKPLLQHMNEAIAQKYGIKNIVQNHQVPCFYLDKKIFDPLKEETQENILQDLKRILLEQEGIKDAWTYKEVQKIKGGCDQIKTFFKNQYFPSRSGQLVYQVHPYHVMIKNTRGTCHATPYDYDTHVPLVLYQHKKFGGKTYADKVWVQQLPASLAHILQVPRPSACTFDFLPGVKREK